MEYVVLIDSILSGKYLSVLPKNSARDGYFRGKAHLLGEVEVDGAE
jgi:hypothetical protein